MGRDNDIAYITAPHRSIDLTAGAFTGKRNTGPEAPKSAIKELNSLDYQNAFDANPVLMWGVDNLFPNKLDTAAELVGILQQGLNRLNQYCYNQGLFLYKVLDDDGETQKVKIVRDKAIEEFLKTSRIINYLRKAINDFYRYGNIFPMYQLNAARKIVRLRTFDAPYCRLEKPHPQTGKSESVYVSAQWPNSLQLSSSVIPDNLKPFVTKYCALDEWDGVDQMRVLDKEYNFIQHLKYITSGKDYGQHPWHAVYFNKWLNISASVPQMKERLFTYAMTICYMIYIDDDYWTTVFGKGFLTLTEIERAEKVKQLQESIEANLLGKDNAFKSLFASLRYTPEGKEKKSILVEAIDNKLREGAFIPDNLHANGEILAALGVDACLLGATVLGDKVSAGSGSNIREAALNLISLLRGDRDVILSPLRVIQEFNGWDPEIQFGFKDFIINTLDGRAPNAGKEAVTT